MTAAALRDAAARAASPEEHEHVTWGLHRHPELYRQAFFSQAADEGDVRWTVDLPDDYAFVAAVYDALYPANPAFTSDDVRALVRGRPDLAHARRRAAGLKRTSWASGLGTTWSGHRGWSAQRLMPALRSLRPRPWMAAAGGAQRGVPAMHRAAPPMDGQDEPGHDVGKGEAARGNVQGDPLTISARIAIRGRRIGWRHASSCGRWRTRITTASSPGATRPTCGPTCTPTT